MRHNLKLKKRTSKTVSNKTVRKVKQRKRNNRSLSAIQPIEDKGFLSSTELEIESRKIHYGYFDRHRIH